MIRLLIAGGIALFIIFILNLFGKNSNPANQHIPDKSEKLNVILTNPDPLEGTTILPTQPIEISFNKEVVLSEFKYRFDPPVEHKVEVVDGTSSKGKTFRIIFIKPLELGQGYTLFVLPNTNTGTGEDLGQEFTYHFKTIRYKGV